MSKIFELLNKSEGKIADLVRPVVGADTPRPTPPPAAAVQEAPSPTPLARLRTLPLRIPAPSPVLPFEDGQWRPSEQYRILRTKLIQHPKQPRLIVISSPGSGDGKSVTAINTAGALALKTEAQVLLLDADMRKPAVHTQLGLPESPGLADLLTGAATLEQALVHTQEFPNLHVITAGTSPANPVELLDTTQWQALCEKLRSLFRCVVLDSPPVGAVADYDLIQAACDGVILVMRPDHTPRPLYRKALETVPKSKLLGVVMNCVPEWRLGGGGGADYYYYSGRRG